VAAALEQALGLAVTLTPGGRGEFTVWLDGKKIADKVRGEFPTEAEVVAAARAAQA
jgi:hypothetical protein